MKSFNQIASTFAITLGLASPGYAADIVNDTWLDGTRTDPASPIYAENNGVVGLDADLDGNLESAWFNGGTAATAVATPGHLTLTMGSSSASWTTYFTPTASPITLAGAGDQLRLTWVFTPSGVNANNTSQAFNLALANSQSATRLTGEGSPASGVYSGYAMFMNMGNTLGNSNPFQLREWVLAGSGNLLSSQANWGANGVASVGLANGATSGNHGYDSGTAYTFMMTLTRNASSGLDIVTTMTGGTLNGTGGATNSITDASANTFTYDTFALRPGLATTTASAFDTSLFRVEFTQVPEPSAIALAGLGMIGLLASYYRRSRR